MTSPCATWEDFDDAYKKACESSLPHDWMSAALVAKQLRSLVSETALPEPMWVGVLEELADLMDGVRSGEYKPDSFTTQPARTLLGEHKATLANEHIQTDRCGFDRSSSIGEDRYVCDCGWREATPSATRRVLVVDDAVSIRGAALEKMIADEEARTVEPHDDKHGISTLALVELHVVEQQTLQDRPASFDRLSEMMRRHYTEMAEHAGRLEDTRSATLPPEAAKLAEQWKDRADDAGRLSRAVLKTNFGEVPFP